MPARNGAPALTCEQSISMGRGLKSEERSCNGFPALLALSVSPNVMWTRKEDTVDATASRDEVKGEVIQRTKQQPFSAYGSVFILPSTVKGGIVI